MNPAILDTAAPVVFFPVRHHSPAAARLVRRLARAIRPAAVLIEGPSDYNPYLPELALGHRLPIAIYSYIQGEEGARRGAYYPFCVYSPEWQALETARELSIPGIFIDLPWAEIAATEDDPEAAVAQRYADGELRRSGYVDTLCRKLGVEDFDTLWDTLFEIDAALDVPEYMERCHRLCHAIRAFDRHVPPSDLRREAFMAERIRRARAEWGTPLLVVTGGFHSHALFDLLATDGPAAEAADEPAAGAGIALTPYSYARLDSLTGYESGMPNPGFYHATWEGGDASDAYRTLLARVARDLRERKQSVSAADLIAVETMARGLAALRAHSRVWRADLIDGVIAALVKDELEVGTVHPFLEALHGVFRGGERGKLAEGTRTPPLAVDIRDLLEAHDLVPTEEERVVNIDLRAETDRERSRVLHRLRLLGIAGFRRVDGTDFTGRGDLSRLWETWSILWSPEYEAGCIESAVYGATLVEAAVARLRERLRLAERDAEAAALAMLDAAMIGASELSVELRALLLRLVREEGDFLRLARALSHLLYLYRYDEALGVAGSAGAGALLIETYERGLWLLEGIGQEAGRDRELTEGVRLIAETFERCAAELALPREPLVDVLRRASEGEHHAAALRGAALGALWNLGEADVQDLLSRIGLFSDPARLGDFLAGLFALARETVQRQPDLMLALDDLLLAYDDEAFLLSLPPLRLAFSYFTPREKHYLARTLLEARGGADAAPLPDLEVDVETAAHAMAIEARLLATVARYGLRGGRAT